MLGIGPALSVSSSRRISSLVIDNPASRSSAGPFHWARSRLAFCFISHHTPASEATISNSIVSTTTTLRVTRLKRPDFSLCAGAFTWPNCYSPTAGSLIQAGNSPVLLCVSRSLSATLDLNIRPLVRLLQARNARRNACLSLGAFDGLCQILRAKPSQFNTTTDGRKSTQMGTAHSTSPTPRTQPWRRSARWPIGGSGWRLM